MKTDQPHVCVMVTPWKTQKCPLIFSMVGRCVSSPILGNVLVFGGVLDGGWTNPVEKYSPNWIISPNRDENQKIFETTTYRSVYHAPCLLFCSDSMIHGQTAEVFRDLRRLVTGIALLESKRWTHGDLHNLCILLKCVLNNIHVHNMYRYVILIIWHVTCIYIYIHVYTVVYVILLCW